uniref:Uncharacterized protein n=1 Tax=viral metagenome TaxID=1070528 RepID=A0A6C0B340_9ZZZZ
MYYLNIIIATTFFIAGLVLCKFYPKIKEFMSNIININKKEPVKEYVPHKRIFNAKSKCFDCERQINQFNTTKYNLVHPTKCFDCEKQINKPYNNLKSNLGHSSKCFSCEN